MPFSSRLVLRKCFKGVEGKRNIPKGDEQRLRSGESQDLSCSNVVASEPATLQQSSSVKDAVNHPRVFKRKSVEPAGDNPLVEKAIELGSALTKEGEPIPSSKHWEGASSAENAQSVSSFANLTQPIHPPLVFDPVLRQEHRVLLPLLAIFHMRRCWGYGVLLYPGISATFNGQKASAGGSLVEGVLAEWVAEPKKPHS